MSLRGYRVGLMEYKSAEMKYQKLWIYASKATLVLLPLVLIGVLVISTTDILDYLDPYYAYYAVVTVIFILPIVALLGILTAVGYLFYYEHMSRTYTVGNDSLVIRGREFRRGILYALMETMSKKYEEVAIPCKNIEHVEVAATPKISTVKGEYKLVGLDGYVPFIRQFMYIVTNTKSNGKTLVYYIDPERREEFVNEIAAKGVKIIRT